MKIYLIAGEASGDLHGSNLIRAISSASDNKALFRGWGGDLMENAGCHIVKHFRDLAFMGFLEVVKNLRTILHNFDDCKKDILEWQPEILILIDYPGFNLRIARWAHEKNIKVVYYITPQVWAWHKSRVHKLGKYTRKLLVILPFEKAFFRQYGYDSTYVGHPLLDAISQFRPDPEFVRNHGPENVYIALLPGSRRQEIKAMLPVMLRAVTERKDLKVLIAGAPSADPSLYKEIMQEENCIENTELIFNHTYDILSVANYALVSSGTATLETALFNVPQVVCYKGNMFSYQIAKRLVDIKFISLVNLVADRLVVQELIQDDLTADNLKIALSRLETNGPKVKADYHEVREKLGGPGASSRAAEAILQLLKPGV